MQSENNRNKSQIVKKVDENSKTNARLRDIENKLMTSTSNRVSSLRPSNPGPPSSSKMAPSNSKTLEL